MNKDEMIKDIRAIIDDRCEAELGQVHAESKGGKVTKTVSTSLIAKDICNAGYQKVAEDEIVIKKSEYENLTKTYAAINSEAYYCGLSVGREEVAKEILQELYDEAISYVCKVVELTTFQIEQRAKEKGIELEKDNGQRRNI